VPNQSNLAYKRFTALARDSAAPLADVLKAADEFLSAYESTGPGPQTIPPYVDVAGFYATKGVRTADILPLLEKGVAEISNAGSFTQAMTHSGRSPFLDDIERALAANVYTQVGRYDKAHELLAAVESTFSRTKAEGLDPQTARIFSAIVFQYSESLALLAIGEGRKEEALKLERAILTQRNPVISPRLLQENRERAQRLWSEMGRPGGDFDTWLANGSR
jgi:tetratricopeptide (TPR) repeat protein